MSEPTAFHKAMADRMMRAFRTRNKKQLAIELAWFHEHAVACAVVRAERERAKKPEVKPKKAAKRTTVLLHEDGCRCRECDPSL